MSEAAPEGLPVEAPAETSEPSWQGPSQTEWEEAQDQLAAYQQQLQQFQQFQQFQQPQYPPQQAPQGPPIPDPWERPDSYAQDFQAYIEHVQAPYRDFQQQVAVAQAEEEAMGILDRLAEQGGEFDRQMAWAKANQLIYQYGNDPRAAQKALEQAARETREYERKVGEAYYQRQLEQVQQTAQGGRGPMPAGLNGAQAAPVGGYGNGPNAVTRRMFGGN